ncbi:MAG: threonine-phosphate decarboxylase CobD [Candidatus Omnitrophica bacterium]|nr:threonine-phosphate decarboxylase CobD [Candidatus Omnitrophota bacterium]
MKESRQAAYHGGDIKAASGQYGIPEDKIVDFSASINPLRHPPAIRKLIRDNFTKIRRYPQPDAAGLTKAIAGYLGVDRHNIMPGCGSIELIYLVVSALRPRGALIFTPAFSEYERALNAVGSKIYRREIGDFNPERGRRPDIVFICNPNNPTADLFEAGDLISFIKRLPSAYFLIDEVFMDFVKDKDRYTLIRQALKNSRIIILGSLTKFFALAGLRAGYVAAHNRTLSKLNKFRYPWMVNYPAQLISEALLKDRRFIEKSREFMFREREYLYRQLCLIDGVKPSVPTANFIFCKSSVNSSRLADLLGRKGILIRDCSTFRGLGSKYFRVAVRTRKENLRLVNELKKILI